MILHQTSTKKEKYSFHKYHNAYKNQYKLEKKFLQEVFRYDLIKIEHVGSTSVPGLGGKGIIDIVIGGSGESLPRYISILTDNGYVFSSNANTKERYFFSRKYATEKYKHTVHIHLTIHEGQDWHEMVSMRDYLISHPEVARQYSEIKREGVTIAQGDGQKYKDYKESFVQEITKKALEG